MRIDHVAIYTDNLEKLRDFYVQYFNASYGTKYINQTTGLQTFFLSFMDGGRLELMTRPELAPRPAQLMHSGLIHLSFSVGGNDKVDELTQRLKKDGYTVLSGPRVTGDGYYESCVLDPDNNQVEIVS